MMSRVIKDGEVLCYHGREVKDFVGRVIKYGGISYFIDEINEFYQSARLVAVKSDVISVIEPLELITSCLDELIRQDEKYLVKSEEV